MEQQKKFNPYIFQNLINKVSNLKLKEQLSQLQNNLERLDTKLNEDLGKIHFLNIVMKKYFSTNMTDDFSKLEKNMNDVENKINDILEKNYIKTPDKMYIEKTTSSDWSILLNIYSLFLKENETFKNLNNNEITTKEIQEKINENLIGILKFKELLLSLHELLYNGIDTLQNFIYDNYNVKDLMIVDNNISPDEKILIISPNKKINEINYGYNEFVLNTIQNTIKQTQNKVTSIYDFSGMIQDMKKVYQKIDEFVDKKYLDVQDGGSNITALLYQININLQFCGKMMNDLKIAFSKYQHLWLRFNNYFSYQILCLSIRNKPQRIYNYIDLETLQKYSKIIKKIINQFNSYLNLENSPEKTSIDYFNFYHYMTVKKMDKFLDFLIQNLPQDKLINIPKCQNQILDNFVIFNQFKDILDVYKKQSNI
jgi:ribosomal protein S20